MLQKPNSRTTRTSVVRMASSLWALTLKDPSLRASALGYLRLVYHSKVVICNICITRARRVRCLTLNASALPSNG
jgi:hypothetical protein